ncbi:hypothetical protein KY347_03975 [Candidatus Woesearchaeota archaeon]|nr:hypothetical protein [Candidatus Woesearchaeota archaeon]
MKLGNTCIRENGRKVNLFREVDKIKQELKAIIPEVDDDKFTEIMGHCRRYYEGNLYYGRRNSRTKKPRDLTHTERLVYDYLLRKKCNPSTTYRWFLATRIPDDVKEKLAKGQIGFKTAMRIAWNRKKAAETNLGILLIEDLRAIIRTL